jgi:hypothetical protein
MGQAGVELRHAALGAAPATDGLGPVRLAPAVAIAAAEIERWKLEPATNNPVAVAAVNAIPNGFAFLDHNHARFGSHHQKVVLVHTGTELVAYVGGIEFSRDRVNRTSKGSPLFDASVRISGPGAQRVLTSFAERWAAHPDGAAHPLTRAGLPSGGGGGTVRVQVGQTYAVGMPFARQIKTASHLTTHAILGARRYFYMEDQYYVGDPQLGAAIKTVLREQPQVIGLVVIAAEDSVTDLADVGFRRRKFINDIVTQFPGRFLVFEAVGDDGTSTGPRAYVHSKLTLVDDEALVIGSMNSSRRSWNHDSEIMASLVDLAGPAGTGGTPGFAKAARMAIWAEHLRLIGQAATQLDSLEGSIAAWAARPPARPASRCVPTRRRGRFPSARSAPTRRATSTGTCSPTRADRSCLALWAGEEVLEDLRASRRGQADAGVGGTVVEVEDIGVGLVDQAAGEHDVGHVAGDLVLGVRPEDPLIRAAQDVGGVLEFEERQPRAVEAARHRVAHPVIDDEPAVLGLQRRGAQPDPRRIPPAPGPAPHRLLRRAPAHEVGRARQPHVGAVGGGRPVEEDPIPRDAPRQQDGVLVLR